ncbi:transcriptional repressor [Gymnodinialimonas ceratoperidinii]|uniref:Transcriptional repressor n=1 Tax=Gymnodinialimonas ceratoperidinii TaxID=2856823 RepID=A0A8F6TZ40_9RHOB|nr:transcriptional repressor [Gymnodinialimonas ceratoperidinii]QXT41113.1 transcriptional repressor [Gymnodinialimonas ceratoperidinii]
METIEFSQHDHARCIKSAVQVVAERCTAERLQLTPVRRRVLEILLEEHRAMGAYDILEILREEGLGAQPPVAYRALDFLTTHGFAHRVERLNAFVACAHSDEDHVPAFLICRVCDVVAEAPARDVRSALSDTAQSAGFTIERATVEALGLCPNCQVSVE